MGNIVIGQASPNVTGAGVVTPRLATGCLYLFALPFVGFGLFALMGAIRGLLAGNLTTAAYAGMFAVVFGGVGFGLIYALRRGARIQQTRDRLRSASPDQPWLWREDWATGSIPASIGNSARMLCGFAMLCFAVSAPGVYAIPQLLAKNNKAILLVLLFPLAGLALLRQAVRAAARWRVVRGSAFEMNSVPGQVGGTLTGKITLPTGLRPDCNFTLGLKCINRVTSNSGGDSSSTWEHVMWNDEQTASSDGASVPVAFYIASDTPASDYSNSNNEIIWQLSASAPTSAGKYDAQFEVPVFKVVQTAEQQRRAEAVRAAEHQQVESYVHPEASRITVRQTPGGATEVYFPPLRSLGATLTTAAFTAIWSALFLMLHGLHVPRIFVIGWGLFDVILVLILLSLLATVRVRIGDGAVTIQKALLGLVYSRRRIEASDVSSIAAVAGMTANNIVYSQLRLSYRGDRKYDFADGIRDKREADWLADQIRQRLGLKQQ
jgi:hypothetical protein